MRFGQKVAIFFQVSFRSFLKALASRSYEKISLTERLYVFVPKAEVTLMSLGAGGSESIQSVTLSIDEAEKVFGSLKRACDQRDIVEIKVGDLSWKVDARSESGRDEVVIVFSRLLEHMRAVAKREDVLAAVAEFGTRFGLK